MVSKHSKVMRDHQLWKDSGLHYEDGINKVLLPKHAVTDPTRSLHNGRHTDLHHSRLLEGMEGIQKRREAAGWTKEQYRQGFQELLLKEREGLLNGQINLYDKGGMK